MSHIICKSGYTVVKRHWVVLLFKLTKFISILLFSYFLFWLYENHLETAGFMADIHYMYIGALWLLIHYAFFSLIFWFIRYFYNVIIIYHNQIVLIKCSLLFKDDIELIDAYRVMKIDSFQRWFWANIIWFWDITLEQQKNDVRTFHFLPDPYRILSILRIQRETLKRNNLNK